MTSAHQISESDIERFEQEGAICLRGLFDKDWLELLREATDRALAAGAQDMSAFGETGKFAGDVNMWMKDDDFKKFAFEGPSWGIAKALMRSATIRLFTDQLFVKEPGTQTATPWHHDQTYWPVNGRDVVSIWVPMDPVTLATGGLEYVKGSHLWNRRFDPEDFGAMSLEFLRDEANEKIPDIEAQRDSYDMLSWDMEPGDCLVHQGFTVHGAGANSSLTHRRRAISTRWFGDDAFFRPFKMFSEEVVGLKAGDHLVSPMFPEIVAS